MFALTSGRKGQERYPRASAQRFVLPRPLRRPARFLVRLCSGGVEIPRHTEAVGITAIFAATALYGSIVGGQFPAAVERTTTALGFAVSEVEISGHVNTSEVAVFEALGLDGFTSLVSLDVAEAREALQGLPWVETASVRKVYPGKIAIDLSEKDAYAIWQTGETLTLIEKDGSLIGAYGGSGFNELPLVVGPGAAERAADFVATLSDYPAVADKMRAIIHVGERRWDVRLANGITIKLPAHDTRGALERLAAMDAETQILDRDVASVDLRLADRTTVALTENAMVRREAALDAREKAIRAAARSSI